MFQAAMLAGAAVARAAVPSVTIAPGVEMPLVGLGTWLYNSTVARAATLSALGMGYTHIDTAFGYNNQIGVGEALKASGLSRQQLFIVSKIPGGLTEQEAAQQLDQSLEQLFPSSGAAEGPRYVDLMLVHFPASWGGEGGKALRQAGWRAMEAFAKAGKAKAIGISHFCRRHLDDILEIATIKPAVNQVQFHVGMGNTIANATDDRAYMKKAGVTYESFSPLCGPCAGTDKTELISGKLVTSIGAKYNKTGPQVALRWQVQQGIPVIPKTANPVHQAQNFDLFSWSLSDADMAALTAATVPAVAGETGPTGAQVSGDCDVP